MTPPARPSPTRTRRPIPSKHITPTDADEANASSSVYWVVRVTIGAPYTQLVVAGDTSLLGWDAARRVLQRQFGRVESATVSMYPVVPRARDVVVASRPVLTFTVGKRWAPTVDLAVFAGAASSEGATRSSTKPSRRPAVPTPR